MKVSNLLKATHKEPSLVIGVTMSTKVSQAAKLMIEKNVGALLVMNDKQLLGIVTERDMVRKLVALSKDANVVEVFQIMTWHPEVVTELTDIVDVLSIMEHGGFRHIPVMDKDTVVGIVSIRDILVALVRHQELIAMNLQTYIMGPGS